MNHVKVLCVLLTSVACACGGCGGLASGAGGPGTCAQCELLHQHVVPTNVDGKIFPFCSPGCLRVFASLKAATTSEAMVDNDRQSRSRT